ncbi:MAG: T9SS type A sorting domain-containing protein, partial [Hymenobacteraceae bacterium]|nr:T9SS type A sorting domain-containing protein [Hymenobacteraceae bacterium]
ATIKLFIDGYQIGTTTASGTNWTVSGLSAANYDLYAGGVLTATATLSPNSESNSSNSVIVSCLPPDASASVASASVTEFCQDGTTTITVTNSQSGVIYSLTNGGTSGSYFGASQLGNNGTLTFTTVPFETAGTFTFTVVAEKATTVCSETNLTSQPTVTVNPNPDVTLSVIAPEYTCYNTATDITISNSQNGFRYQLKDASTGADVESPVLGTGGNINLTTGTLTADKTFYVEVVDITKTTNCTKRFVADFAVKADCPAEYTNYTETTRRIVSDYTNGDVLASAQDPDNGVVAAELVTGSLPNGTALRTSGAGVGDIYVEDNTQLDDVEYSFSIKTTDFYGGTTTKPLTIKLSATPLPVSLIAFTAKVAGTVVNLNWSTASEINNKHFVVERSQNGKEFVAVGTVKGNGTTNQAHVYSFTDQEPLKGQSYYRLKQVDTDDKFEYSRVAAVKFMSEYSSLQVYPNPAKQEVNLSFEAKENQFVQLQVLNMQGQQVLQLPFEATAGANELKLQLEKLTPGMYLINVTGSTFNSRNKLVIE